MVAHNDFSAQAQSTPPAHSPGSALDTLPCPCAERCPNLPRLRRALWLLRKLSLLIAEAHLDERGA